MFIMIQYSDDTVRAPKKMYIDPITSQLTLGVETNVVGLTTHNFIVMIISIL